MNEEAETIEKDNNLKVDISQIVTKINTLYNIQYSYICYFSRQISLILGNE